MRCKQVGSRKGWLHRVKNYTHVINGRDRRIVSPERIHNANTIFQSSLARVLQAGPYGFEFEPLYCARRSSHSVIQDIWQTLKS